MSMEKNTFSIKGKSLKCDAAESVDPHLQPLVSDQDVQVVVFGGNTFGIGACEQIGLVLKEKEKLEEADLADIFTGRLISEIPQSLGALCNSLLNLANLTRVDLSDNAFGGRCVDVMVPFLSSHLPLEELRLANNGLGPAGATVIANALYDLGMKAKEAGQTSRLRKIICGRNRCENGSTKAWGKVFQVHPELIEVRLFQNDIRNHGWDPIMAGLAHCSKLQVLDMYDNTATEKGSRAVANALPHLVSLRELNLGDCLLRPRGGAIIARALKLGSNLKLEHLKMSGSEIDEEVVGLLVEYVKEFGSQLKKVELNDNFGDADAAGELSGIWGEMKEALDAWDNGAELDELDEIVERDSDDEDENSEGSDGGDDEEDAEEEEEKHAVEESSDSKEKPADDQVEDESEEAKPSQSTITDAQQVVIDAEQVVTATEQVNADTEQMKTDAEQVNTDAEQVNTDAEQINANAEQINTDSEQVNTDTEQMITEAEQVNINNQQMNTISERVVPDAEEVTPEVTVAQAKQPVVATDIENEGNPQVIAKAQETEAGGSDVTNPTSSTTKGKSSKQGGLYDLLTQTLEALKLT